jgi:N-acetylglucosaminyldiphosphoundecaprenol N-acetyl-beta-D-mannosaminyltransferase
MQEKVNVLGIRFDNVNLKETIDFVFDHLDKNKKGYICTPNPEMLLEAKHNNDFKKVLNNSLLNISDGIGILWAATHIVNKSSKFKAITSLPFLAISPKKFKNVLSERVTGTDLLQEIVKHAANTHTRIFFLGASPGIAEKAAQILEKKYNGVKIVGTYSGSPDKKHKKDIIETINHSRADIVFVAYGAPKQEMWIEDALKALKTIKLAIGIGGAFDFIVEKRKRAPKWMQKLGLEWLFRLIQEPSRWRRIYNATIKFPIHVIKTLK